MKNIVLIGMMGCGKTTVGRRLAKRLERRFVDTDQYIEAAQGRSIPEIFACQGEAYFRELERETAETLARERDLVIACGGGLPTRAEAIAALKDGATVFWLNRDPGEIYDTVSMAGRPLGQDGRSAFLERFAQREPIYRRWADHIISGTHTPAQTAEAILEVLRHELSDHQRTESESAGPAGAGDLRPEQL